MIVRRHIHLEGAVQGVGFRPFVFRVARSAGITGSVFNNNRGVVIEAEGDPELLDTFLRTIKGDLPPLARITRWSEVEIAAVGELEFVIGPSRASGRKTAVVLPDVATCGDCLREIFDPRDRRYLYPFTNCTNCGPRYSIIEKLPYDRCHTTMKAFPLCDECRKEYDDADNRRYHAQPNACPSCGPKAGFLDGEGRSVAVEGEALERTVQFLRMGAIIAVKGLGGFHLLASARRGESIAGLRQRKGREEKPFALLFPELEMVRAECDLSPEEEELLTSPEAPIVLLRRKHSDGRSANEIAHEVAPGNPDLGIMLPCTPLHHLLLKELSHPVVATSGNISNEPIVIDETEAISRLSGIADYFLVHNRPIARHLDDSIVRVAAGRELMLRRSRGYAPLPVQLSSDSGPLVAVGAHQKNTVATAVNRSVFISQHIGDLESAEAHRVFEKTLDHLEGMHSLEPRAVACDLHPDYLSTRYAHASGRRVIPVQHHVAHVLACMAEHQIDGPVLGVSWDGTGYGTDGTVWGGEFLAVNGASFRRFAHLRPFPLPGGEKGVREPRRSALGLLYEMFGSEELLNHQSATADAFNKKELAVLVRSIRKGVNAPITSSAGRLFDAVASLLGIRQISSYEGQAAMELEQAAGRARGLSIPEWKLPLVERKELLIVDWEPVVRGILAEGGGITDGSASSIMHSLAIAFHKSLVCAIVDVACRSGERRVVLTGGCFQNRLLLEGSIEALRNRGMEVFWHRTIPPNDGGIALGQIEWARRLLLNEES